MDLNELETFWTDIGDTASLPYTEFDVITQNGKRVRLNTYTYTEWFMNIDNIGNMVHHVYAPGSDQECMDLSFEFELLDSWWPLYHDFGHMCIMCDKELGAKYDLIYHQFAAAIDYIQRLICQSIQKHILGF